MVVVVATIRAREGREAELEQVLRGLVPETRREEGCVQYDLHQAEGEPGLFTFYERWESGAHLEAHFQTPHLRAARERFDDLVGDEPSIVRYTLIA